MSSCCEACGRRLTPTEQLLVKALDGQGVDCSCRKPSRSAQQALSSRLLPWEVALLREEGVLPRRRQPPTPSRRSSAARPESPDESFGGAVAEALALATQLRHVMALSRIYAQAAESPTTRRPSSEGGRRPASHEVLREELERTVKDREKEYRALLQVAATEGSETPLASTSHRLIRAIHRLDRATAALREFDRSQLSTR